MNEAEFILAIIGMVGSFGLVWGLGYAVHSWLKDRRRPAIGTDALAELSEQVAQLQTSVDAIAVEVERVSEGQRFTTRLLSERADAPRVERGGPAH